MVEVVEDVPPTDTSDNEAEDGEVKRKRKRDFDVVGRSAKPKMKVEDSGIDVGDTTVSAGLIEECTRKTMMVRKEDDDFATWMLTSLGDDWTKDLDG